MLKSAFPLKEVVNIWKWSGFQSKLWLLFYTSQQVPRSPEIHLQTELNESTRPQCMYNLTFSSRGVPCIPKKYFITITNWFQNHALCILKLGLPVKPGRTLAGRAGRAHRCCDGCLDEAWEEQLIPQGIYCHFFYYLNLRIWKENNKWMICCK